MKKVKKFGQNLVLMTMTLLMGCSSVIYCPPEIRATEGAKQWLRERKTEFNDEFKDWLHRIKNQQDEIRENCD